MDRPFGRVGGGGGYSEPAKGKSAADVLLGLGGAPAQKHVAFTADTKPSQAAAALLGGAPAPAPAPAAAGRKFSRFLDMFGYIGSCWDAFGWIRMHLEASARFPKQTTAQT